MGSNTKPKSIFQTDCKEYNFVSKVKILYVKALDQIHITSTLELCNASKHDFVQVSAFVKLLISRKSWNFSWKRQPGLMLHIFLGNGPQVYQRILAQSGRWYATCQVLPDVQQIFHRELLPSVLALEYSIGGEPPVSCCHWWSPQTPSLPNSCQMVLFSTSLQIGIPLCLITIQTLQNLWHHLPHSTPVLQRWPIHSVAPALCNPVCQWRRSWFVEVLAWICQHNPHALLFHMLQDHGCRYGWRTMHIHQQCIVGDIILLPSQEVLTFWWCGRGVSSFLLDSWR